MIYKTITLDQFWTQIHRYREALSAQQIDVRMILCVPS